jgi:hypothetical protein
MEFKEPEILFNAIKRGIEHGYDKAYIHAHIDSISLGGNVITNSIGPGRYVIRNSTGPDRDVMTNSIMIEILRCLDEIL